jgi:hypothetical protein
MELGGEEDEVAVAAAAAVVAEQEGFTLHLSSASNTGYRGVRYRNGRFHADGDGGSRSHRWGKRVSLGSFATAAAAAVAYARHIASMHGAVGVSGEAPAGGEGGEGSADSVGTTQQRGRASGTQPSSGSLSGGGSEATVGGAGDEGERIGWDQANMESRPWADELLDRRVRIYWAGDKRWCAEHCPCPLICAALSP